MAIKKMVMVMVMAVTLREAIIYAVADAISPQVRGM